jgi:hypothetical protein
MRAAIVLLGLLLGLPAAASELEYKGWHFNTSAVHGELPDALVQSLQAQIDLIERLNLKPEIKAFFREVEVRVDPATLGHTAFYRSLRGPGLIQGNGKRLVGVQRVHRIYLGTQPIPPIEPIFLRTLLFAYLDQEVPDGRRNRRLRSYFDRAHRTEEFAIGSKMLESSQLFFAHAVSVVLLGRSTEEPFDRAKVRKYLPDFYDWIVGEFAADGAL